jgi:hypothetical protein
MSTDAARKIIAVTSATVLRVFSTDFLLQYSHHPENPATHAQSHHFGLISKTEPTNNIQLTRSIIIAIVLISMSNK